MKLLLCLTLLTFTIAVQAQSKPPVGKYIVSTLLENGVDNSGELGARNHRLIFYLDKKEGLSLDNGSDVLNLHSFGKLWRQKSDTIYTAIEKQLQVDDYYRWKYHNNYDVETGYATIHLKRVFKPGGVAFNIKLLTQDLSLYEYSGFKEVQPIEKRIPIKKRNTQKRK